MNITANIAVNQSSTSNQSNSGYESSGALHPVSHNYDISSGILPTLATPAR